MRRVIAFPCKGETLIGTLDPAAGHAGLLIVSGGNEPRMGAHRGMALLAARLADQGWPVFRYDRRGVGDSSGDNGGWASSAPDLAAAAAAFHHEQPQLTKSIGFGNCDAATTLALFGEAAGIDALILANPWVVEPAGDLPPAAAIRARYLDRLRSPASWLRGFDLRKALAGLRTLAAPAPARPLAHRFTDAVNGREATVILAKSDATAIAYADAMRRLGVDHPPIEIDTASHSFARPEDTIALEQAIVAALNRYSAASASS